MAPTAFQAAVARVLDALEAGQVVTYGEVAAEAGFPGAARAVGTYLRHHPGNPWWRVVRGDGHLLPGHQREQARLLAAEGVRLSPDGSRLPRH